MTLNAVPRLAAGPGEGGIRMSKGARVCAWVFVICLIGLGAGCSTDGVVHTNGEQRPDASEQLPDVADAADLPGEGGRARLDVFVDGAGSGVVESIPAGIHCGLACNASYERHTQVTLTASADQGSHFAGWSGACTGDSTTCHIDLAGDDSVRATFACTPDCSGRECGDDGCGASCGDCTDDDLCNSSGACVADCTPDCSGRECGDDGCGSSCGSCPGTQICNPSGDCMCQDGERDEHGVCDMWILSSNASEWRGYRIDSASSPNAPSSPIRAAFDIEEDNLAFVLTDDTIYEFRPSDRSWIDASPLADLDPGLPATPLASAYTIPAEYSSADGNDETAMINGVSAGQLYQWQKNYHRSSGEFSNTDADIVGEPVEWGDPNAPAPNQVNASTVVHRDDRGWIDASLPADCESRPVAGYLLYFADTSLYFIGLDEQFTCSAWLNPMAVSDFEPILYEGAPPADRVGAAFWHQGGLIVFGR